MTTYVTNRQFTESMLTLYDHILGRMEVMAEGTQADIDALTTQVQGVGSRLSDVRNTLQTEIDALAANGVDISGLQAAVAPLDSEVQALENLQPTSPPSPEPSA